MNTDTGEGITQALAEFAAQVKFEDIPKEVVHQTKRVIFDSIGCTLGGYSSEKGYIARNFVKKVGGNPEATIIGSDTKNSVINAAFANANMGNGIDIDDTIMMTHPAVPTLMGALPLAERDKVSGKDLITAVATGYDIAIRIGGASESWLKIAHGKIRTLPVHGYSWHTFGAAAAAARILGLDAKQMVHVFGLAANFASMPVMAAWSNPVDSLPLSKYYEAGWTTQGGVSAAMLAQEGYTGPAEILEGRSGFWRMRGREDCNYEFMVDRLGKQWWIMDTSLKPWPCCRFIHHSLTAFSRIIDEYDIKAEEMESVAIKGSMLYAPIFYVMHPKGPVNMQFSTPHSLANIAYRVIPGPKWQYPETADDPRMKEFREKVSIEPNTQTLEIMAQDLAGERPRQPRRVPTTVEVTARGKVYRESVDYAKGDPPAWVEGMEMTDEELKTKFRNQAVNVLRMSDSWREKIERAIETTYNLEKVNDITGLMSLLTP